MIYVKFIAQHADKITIDLIKIKKLWKFPVFTSLSLPKQSV
jgi:hypothetical protein